MMEDQIKAFIRRSWDILDEVNDEDWGAKRQLAAALRKLNHLVVCSSAPAADLLEAARRIDEALLLVQPFAAPTFFDRFKDGDYVARPEIYADRSWITGQSNPISPLAVLTESGDQVRATVCFENGYVGAPGWVHGGAVASVFDQLMGFVLIRDGSPCVTAELSVRYHHPTPSHQELVFKAWMEREEGRYVVLKATCHHGDQHTATSDATFVRLNPMQFAENLAASVSD